jgi:two-component system phosphate regulon response regulator PhoB
MDSRILVVEDEPAIQELVAVNLEYAGYRVERARSAEEADIFLRAALPDLIILDWMLPGLSGFAYARKLREADRTQWIPIIMLTARVQERDKIEGLEVGADDYITKPFSPKELLARIKAVLRRRAPEHTDDTVEISGLKLDPATHRVSGNGQSVELGPTEFRLLHFFMSHPERVYSRRLLLDHVWGDHVFVEERTVDVHIRRLRKALSASGHDRLVETVRSNGYRFESGLIWPHDGPLAGASRYNAPFRTRAGAHEKD